MSYASAKSGQVTESIKCCWCGSEVQHLFTEADIDQGVHRTCPGCGHGLAVARVFNCNLQSLSYITAPGGKGPLADNLSAPRRKEIKLPRF
jgi:DNA-directed RNA polymerase subunit RPC12/RpoP